MILSKLWSSGGDRNQATFIKGLFLSDFVPWGLTDKCLLSRPKKPYKEEDLAAYVPNVSLMHLTISYFIITCIG